MNAVIRAVPDPAEPPLVVWWADREHDWEMPRLSAIGWQELDGPRGGIIRVPSRWDVADTGDPMVGTEVELQVAQHFPGPIQVAPALGYEAELDPLTRLRAHGHRVTYRSFAGRYGPEQRGGVAAERANDRIGFTVVIADHLSAQEGDQVADWALMMIKTFQIEGPARWTDEGPGRWQILARTTKPLNPI